MVIRYKRDGISWNVCLDRQEGASRLGHYTPLDKLIASVQRLDDGTDTSGILVEIAMFLAQGWEGASLRHVEIR